MRLAPAGKTPDALHLDRSTATGHTNATHATHLTQCRSGKPCIVTCMQKAAEHSGTAPVQLADNHECDIQHCSRIMGSSAFVQAYKPYSCPQKHNSCKKVGFAALCQSLLHPQPILACVALHLGAPANRHHTVKHSLQSKHNPKNPTLNTPSVTRQLQGGATPVELVPCTLDRPVQ
jgi:hypothetical protein